MQGKVQAGIQEETHGWLQEGRHGSGTKPAKCPTR